MTARPMTERTERRRAFLAEAGFEKALARPLAGDASTRSYERLALGDRRAILMNAPPAAESAACPPGASPEERRELGYNAMARLAGPNLNAFVSIARALGDAGLSVPGIYAADAVDGFALIEDLGDDLYVRAVREGANEKEIYAAAIDALIALRAAAPAAPRSPSYSMLAYDQTALEAETGLVLDWYWPHLKGAPAEASIRAESQALWSDALATLTPPSLIVLRDFHAENLLWLPARKAHQRAGVIDFQDGLVGNPAYDLVSLLEDARRDVSSETVRAMIERYCDRAREFDGFDREEFLRDYAILGAQRNAKILGIFARLINRDGKARYADFFPRVEAHFRGDLAHPELAPLKRFYAAHFGDRF